MDLTQLLAFSMQNNASDLHLSSTSPPIIRVNGQIKRIKAEPLSSDQIRQMLYSVMTEEQRADFERDLILILQYLLVIRLVFVLMPLIRVWEFLPFLEQFLLIYHQWMILICLQLFVNLRI